jgi:hypothetical protein
MTLSETPPEGLLDWIKAQKLDWREYIIYRAGWQADPLTGIKHRCADCICTHCGAHFKAARADGTPFGFFSPVSGDAIKSGNKLLCPECGAETEAKHVSAATHLERYVWPMSAEAQDGKLLLYLWRVCRDIEKTGEVVWSAFPWELYIFGAKTAEKYVHWGKSYTTVYTFSRWKRQTRLTDTMLDIALVYCPEGLSGVYAQTECANCKLESYMSVETEYRFPVAWMKLWQRHKSAEALTAPNAKKLTAALITEGKRSPAYNKNWSERTDVLHGVDWKKKKPHELLRLTKEELTYFNGAEDAPKRLKALLLARKYNVPCRLGEEVTKVTEVRQEDFLKRGVLPGKAERYLDRQAARYKSRLWPGYLLDYWTMAERLGEDLTERDMMWPQNLKRAHDQMQERQKAEAAEKRREAFQQRYERMKRYAFEDGDILIRACETEEELIAEGKALHHCVASYAERHARGELTIFFIRRKDKPDEPWYTLNFNEKKLSVTENRGMCNCARTDEVRNFENTWLEWIRSGRKRRTSAA